MTIDDDATETVMVEPAMVEPARRGSLVLAKRAVVHVAETALTESRHTVHHPKVTVQAVDDQGVELRSAFGVDYPSEPLSAVLADVRNDVSARVSALLGRPVRVLDIAVDELVSVPAPRRAV